MLIPHIAAYERVLGVINAHPHEYRYEFIDNAKYASLLRKDIRAGNTIYVQELLFRAHIAAITTLYRNEKWILGINSALQSPNYFAFCACLRGLVECAADSHSCLIYVPGTLADNYRNFFSALKGRITAGVVCCRYLEDILIHYSHGKKQAKGASVPPSHIARQSQEYLQSLEDAGSTTVRNLYTELCEVTHPAERTVAAFVWRETVDSENYVIRKGLDSEFIADLVNRYASAFPNVFQMSFNAALLTLYALNRFDDSRFYTQGVESIELNDIPAFGEFQRRLHPA